MFFISPVADNLSTALLMCAVVMAVGGENPRFILLSIGSAAGVALMGQARGKCAFFGHLKGAPVIELGYIASIFTHLWINSAYM